MAMKDTQRKTDADGYKEQLTNMKDKVCDLTQQNNELRIKNN